MFKQLDAIDAINKALMNNVLMRRYDQESRLADDDEPMPFEQQSDMIRHVGCQRFKSAIQEYQQVRSTVIIYCQA